MSFTLQDRRNWTLACQTLYIAEVVQFVVLAEDSFGQISAMLQYRPYHLGMTDTYCCGWHTLMCIVCTESITEAKANGATAAKRSGGCPVSAGEVHRLMYSTVYTSCKTFTEQSGSPQRIDSIAVVQSGQKNTKTRRMVLHGQYVGTSGRFGIADSNTHQQSCWYVDSTRVQSSTRPLEHT